MKSYKIARATDTLIYITNNHLILEHLLINKSIPGTCVLGTAPVNIKEVPSYTHRALRLPPSFFEINSSALAQIIS
jgi:hypothetical protein